MWGKLQARFVDSAGIWYKKWSAWLAGGWALIVATVWYNPSSLAQLAAYVPEPWRTRLALPIGLISGALPILIANMKQAKLQSPPPDGQ
jgi:hypothetical protein